MTSSRLVVMNFCYDIKPPSEMNRNRQLVCADNTIQAAVKIYLKLFEIDFVIYFNEIDILRKEILLIRSFITDIKESLHK